jgi:hypothetical protein
LLKGKVHHLFGAAGLGKTMIAVWLAKQSIERGETVVYCDDENGKRTFSERLQLMGVDPATVDDHLWYLPFPGLTMGAEMQGYYQGMLDEVRPDLIIFDSWISFLAGSDMDENANSDVQRWCTAYTQPARARGVTTLILDHVPHDGTRSRGASRKRDEADVQWQIVKASHFDRDTVGEVSLTCQKDREAWLERKVTFSIGGTGDNKLMVKRAAGTVEEPSPTTGLTPSAHQLLDTLRDQFPEKGANPSEWAKAAGVSRQSVYRFKGDLIGRGLVREERKRYFPTPQPDPDVTPRTARKETVTPERDGDVTPESGTDKPNTPEVSQGVTECNSDTNVTPDQSVTGCNTPLGVLHPVTDPATDSEADQVTFVTSPSLVPEKRRRRLTAEEATRMGDYLKPEVRER